MTVFRQIATRLPEESLIYLGDTARVPYGSKSRNTVIRYAQACARLLLAQDIKLLVVACNTASAFALEALQDSLEVPVIGVVEPGARAALARSRNRRIGVIGTVGAINSGAYTEALQRIEPEVVVHAQACPLFVPLAEEGWTHGEVPRKVADAYLQGLLAEGIDTLVLGCTHYPLLKDTIQETLGPKVTLVDSAEETAVTVAQCVTEMRLSAAPGVMPLHRFLVSDAPESFQRVSRHFLQMPLLAVEWVDF